MSQPFQFELVSPEKLLFSKDAIMVTVPGGEGDYGVLAGHAPLITTVRAGVIDIYEQDDKTISERIFVAGGFAEVTSDRCTVLAEEAVPFHEMDRATLEIQVRNLTESISYAKSDAERNDLTVQLTIAQVKLDLLASN